MKTFLIFLFCFFSTRASAGSRCESLFANQASIEFLRNLDQQTPVLNYGLENLLSILESGKSREQKIIRSLLSQISLNKKTTPPEVQSVVIKLYKIANSPKTNLEKTLREKISSIEERKIKTRIELEILQNGIFTALQNLGLMRDLTRIDRLRLFINKSANVHEFIISGALNTFTLYWMNLVGAIPAIQMMEFQKITPEIIELVKTKGFNAAYPQLLKVFKNKARVDIVFMAAARVYTLYMFMLIPQIVYEHYDMIKFGVGMATMTEESLREYEAEHFDPRQVRFERQTAWREGYEAFNGKLNEADPADRKIIQEHWQMLINTRDENLKVFQ
jgi:hypothetical protein